MPEKCVSAKELSDFRSWLIEKKNKGEMGEVLVPDLGTIYLPDGTRSFISIKEIGDQDQNEVGGKISYSSGLTAFLSESGVVFEQEKQMPRMIPTLFWPRPKNLLSQE